MSKALWLPDMGDGTYQNPILFADYSDPDAIRVGDTYYLTASTFNYVPGLPILTSKDLVNWTLVNYALPNIPEPRYERPCHAQGVWAPAIRWHDGYFYIYYGMPDEGIYMVRTRDPLGAWDAPVCVLPGKGLIDPCPVWDEDGKAWVVHGYAKSRIGFKSILGIFPMTREGMRATGDDHLLYDGQRTQPTIEGPKVYRREGWYYIFAPAGGVATGWQTVLRSRSLHGPFEERVVLKQGSTEVNGPHQGAWVETPEGESWFLHFQSRGLYGRITHLQPMRWNEDGWPTLGVEDSGAEIPADRPVGEDAGEAAALANAADCGVPCLRHAKPIAPMCERAGEEPGDNFHGKLELQWQFMGNWREDFYDFPADGVLRLHARKLPKSSAPVLWECPQTLTQKLVAPAFTATTTLDASGLRVGSQAGLGLVGGQYAYMALRRNAEGLWLVYVESQGSGTKRVELPMVEMTAPAEKLTVRMVLKQTAYNQAEATFFYGTDEKALMIPFGKTFSPERHTWVGARIALFAMPLNGEDGGSATFSALRVEA